MKASMMTWPSQHLNKISSEDGMWEGQLMPPPGQKQHF